jgi:hypothetical protein
MDVSYSHAILLTSDSRFVSAGLLANHAAESSITSYRHSAAVLNIRLRLADSLQTHSSDQVAHLFGDPRAASEWTGLPSPIRGKTHSMPTHHCLFVLFTSRADAVPDAYRRYLVNSLRDKFDLLGTPIRLTLREKKNPYAQRKPAPLTHARDLQALAADFWFEIGSLLS